MRKIKFRFWCKDGQMSKGFLLQETTGKENWDNLIPMQFTGLKDKHDKEIYEGDIVRGILDMKDKNGEDISEVRWDYSKVGFCFSGLFIFNFQLLSDTTKGYDIEVIGNIYENAKLLKEVNK